MQENKANRLIEAAIKDFHNSISHDNLLHVLKALLYGVKTGAEIIVPVDIAEDMLNLVGLSPDTVQEGDVIRLGEDLHVKYMEITDTDEEKTYIMGFTSDEERDKIGICDCLIISLAQILDMLNSDECTFDGMVINVCGERFILASDLVQIIMAEMSHDMG